MRATRVGPAGVRSSKCASALLVTLGCEPTFVVPLTGSTGVPETAVPVERTAHPETARIEAESHESEIHR